MASALSLPSQSLSDFSSPQLRWGSTLSGAVPPNTQLYRQPSGDVLKSSQNGFSTVSIVTKDEVVVESRYHYSVECLEKKSTASEDKRPKIVMKFRLQCKNKIDDATANVTEKTVVSANGEESTSDQILENKSTEPSKLMEGQTLVATEGGVGSPPLQNASGKVVVNAVDQTLFETLEKKTTPSDVRARNLVSKSRKQSKNNNRTEDKACEAANETLVAKKMEMEGNQFSLSRNC